MLTNVLGFLAEYFHRYLLYFHLVKDHKNKSISKKGVTIFHVALVKCNGIRKTPNGYQKFDITEKTIILNFYYYKLKRFYNRDPFF